MSEPTSEEIKDVDPRIKAAAQYMGGVLRSRVGLWGLGTISFIESALVVPIIADPFMVVYMLANRRKIMHAVIMTSLASVVGGTAAYLMAYAFFDLVVAQHLVGDTGRQFYEIAARFQNNTFILSFIGAFTPVPYTLTALVVGFVKGNVAAFIAASVIGRTARFGIVGYIVHRFGAGAVAFTRTHLALMAGLTFFICAAYLAYNCAP